MYERSGQEDSRSASVPLAAYVVGNILVEAVPALDISHVLLINLDDVFLTELCRHEFTSRPFGRTELNLPKEYTRNRGKQE